MWFYLPEKSHFDYLLGLSEQEDIPPPIKKPMEGIEQHKPEPVGSLPKDEFFNLELKEDEDSLRDYSLTASLLKIINSIPRSLQGDVFGKVYEYFLGMIPEASPHPPHRAQGVSPKTRQSHKILPFSKITPPT